jgi:C4-dicarboxylate-specific signal transduction histidine kinase
MEMISPKDVLKESDTSDPLGADACQTLQQMANIGFFSLDLHKKQFIGHGKICRIFETDSQSCTFSYAAFFKTVHPEDRGIVKDVFAAAKRAPLQHRIDFRLMMPDGRIKHVAATFDLRTDEAGTVRYATGALQDISSLKILQHENALLQQLLTQQSKVAQMGEVIESIVHQWKQPLYQINSILVGVERLFEGGSLTSQRLASKLDEIEMLTGHMAQTVESFKHFFRSNGEAATFCISDATEDVIRLLEKELKRSGVAWEFSVEGTPVVSGSEKEFSQALLSILNNARECFIHRNVARPKLWIDIEKTAAEVTVTVSDNAGGIPAQYINKIFDLYFTTKRQGHGTGLGLYIAKMLIEKGMHGTIVAENREAGAAFTIYLPTGDARDRT